MDTEVLITKTYFLVSRIKCDLSLFVIGFKFKWHMTRDGNYLIILRNFKFIDGFGGY